MYSDISKPSREQVIDLINHDNNTNFTANQIHLGVPSKITGQVRNTAIDIEAVPQQGFTGGQDVIYDRMNLAGLSQRMNTLFEYSGTVTATMLVNAINQRAGSNIALGVDVMNFANFTSTSGGRTVEIIATPTSLAWEGTLAITVRDPVYIDPDWVSGPGIIDLVWPIGTPTHKVMDPILFSSGQWHFSMSVADGVDAIPGRVFRIQTPNYTLAGYQNISGPGLTVLTRPNARGAIGGTGGNRIFIVNGHEISFYSLNSGNNQISLDFTTNGRPNTSGDMDPDRAFKSWHYRQFPMVVNVAGRNSTYDFMVMQGWDNGPFGNNSQPQYNSSAYLNNYYFAKYDPVSGIATVSETMTNMPTLLAPGAAAIRYGNYIYVIGHDLASMGTNNPNNCRIYRYTIPTTGHSGGTWNTYDSIGGTSGIHQIYLSTFGSCINFYGYDRYGYNSNSDFSVSDLKNIKSGTIDVSGSTPNVIGIKNVSTHWGGHAAVHIVQTSPSRNVRIGGGRQEYYPISQGPKSFPYTTKYGELNRLIQYTATSYD